MQRSIKSIYRLVNRCINSLWDKRLDVDLPVRVSGRKVFKIHDYGIITRYRASSFESKEPETIDWIDSFAPGESLLDIGANIGVYSLYAASKGSYVVAMEPDALNYALLNLNIRLNNFGKTILPYSVAVHNEAKFSKFNISSYEWGGALNSFDNTLDFAGNTYKPVHSQGVYGIPLDEFLPQINFKPVHIKIDVDGNENLILSGAYNSLRCSKLKSILVELDESRNDYIEAIQLIEQAGFVLNEKTHAERFESGKFSKIYNHIFFR
jgi:FkbM family methyltransferase